MSSGSQRTGMRSPAARAKTVGCGHASACSARRLAATGAHWPAALPRRVRQRWPPSSISAEGCMANRHHMAGPRSAGPAAGLHCKQGPHAQGAVPHPPPSNAPRPCNGKTAHAGVREPLGRGRQGGKQDGQQAGGRMHARQGGSGQAGRCAMRIFATTPSAYSCTLCPALLCCPPHQVYMKALILGSTTCGAGANK